MSRSPRIEIEPEKFHKLIVLSGNKLSDLERQFEWGHDYLASCERQGWISQARLSVLCKHIGVDERLMKKSANEKEAEQLSFMPPALSENNSTHGAFIKFCDDMANTWARLRDNLQEVKR